MIDSSLEEAVRLSNLTEDLLKLARSDAGVMTLRLEEVDLGERLRFAVDRLQARIEDKELRVSVDVPAEATGLYDAKLVDQLVWNLLDNAVKFSTPGGAIEASIVSSGEEFVLTVADTGPGIPEEAIRHIFDRFSRVDDAHAAEGTGLGLSIVQAIAEAHGGTVTAANGDTGGTRFQVHLPRVLKP